MNAATTPPSRIPPKPGAGLVGSWLSPSATRRVGAIGREWKTSNSARITGAAYWPTRAARTTGGSHERPQDAPQVAGLRADLFLVNRVLDEQVDQVGHPLLEPLPLPGIHPVRRPDVLHDLARLDDPQRALGVLAVVLEPVGGHEDLAHQLGVALGALVGPVLAALAGLAPGDPLEQGVDGLLVVGVDVQLLAVPLVRQARPSQLGQQLLDLVVVPVDEVVGDLVAAGLQRRRGRPLDDVEDVVDRGL